MNTCRDSAELFGFVSSVRTVYDAKRQIRDVIFQQLTVQGTPFAAVTCTLDGDQNEKKSKSH
jgi:hypothetical protein